MKEVENRIERKKRTDVEGGRGAASRGSFELREGEAKYIDAKEGSTATR